MNMNKGRSITDPLELLRLCTHFSSATQNQFQDLTGDMGGDIATQNITELLY